MKFRLDLTLTPWQCNILVDNYGHARISDFGNAMVERNSDSLWSGSGPNGHAPRWSAPEVLKEFAYSKESDIFSFAMVMVEVRHKWLPVLAFGLLSVPIHLGLHRCDSFQ